MERWTDGFAALPARPASAIMDHLETIRRSGLALAIGLHFVPEQGSDRQKEFEGACIVGLRTFPIAGLIGGISGWLATLDHGREIRVGLAFIAGAAMPDIEAARLDRADYLMPLGDPQPTLSPPLSGELSRRDRRQVSERARPRPQSAGWSCSCLQLGLVRHDRRE